MKYAPKAEHIIWSKSRKYNMSQTHKIHAEANAENTSGPHDVGRASVAPHKMVAAASSGHHHEVIHHVAR